MLRKGIQRAGRVSYGLAAWSGAAVAVRDPGILAVAESLGEQTISNRTGTYGHRLEITDS